MTEDVPDKTVTVDEMADTVCRAAIGAILIARILSDAGLIKKEDKDKGRPVVNMCARGMRKSEMKELKRQNRMIMKRYGGKV